MNVSELSERLLNYSKPPSIIPVDDEVRLQKLYSYDILDTHAEETFDQLARLAAEIFEVPAAFITFVDRERVFFKSNYSSIPGNQVLRKDSLCSLAILREGLTLFTDTHQVPDLLESPHVSSPGGIRFYAGAPLKTTEGHQLGTICVTDSEPRQATQKQMAMLEMLSSVVIDKLESGVLAKRAIRAQTDLMNFTVHDLRNPASTILFATQLLQEDVDDTESVLENTETIKTSAKRILDGLTEMLSLSKIENGQFKLELERIDLTGILNQVVRNLQGLAIQKQQEILFETKGQLMQVEGDSHRITEILENLLSNAIKYSYPGGKITLALKDEDNSVLVSVKDEGQGLVPDDHGKLFTRFAHLSAKPTGKERSNGLGLSIVRTLVELHKGEVWAESEGANRGTTFFVRFSKQIG